MSYIEQRIDAMMNQVHGKTEEDPTSRLWTTDETREQVMRHFAGIADYWAESAAKHGGTNG